MLIRGSMVYINPSLNLFVKIGNKKFLSFYKSLIDLYLLLNLLLALFTIFVAKNST